MSEELKVPMWTLESGIEVCRVVEALLDPAGFHCALGGGVMKKGSSQKDLDIFVYPHKSNGCSFLEEVEKILSPVMDAPLGKRDHSSYGDDKTVYSANKEGKRIDFFLLQ